MERRAHPRIDIRLRCELEVLRSQRVYEGITVNLSRTGALVELEGAAEDLAAGDTVVLRIELPARALFEQKCMECSSVISRCETGLGKTAVVSVQIWSVRFRNAERMLARMPGGDGSRMDCRVN